LFKFHSESMLQSIYKTCISNLKFFCNYRHIFFLNFNSIESSLCNLRIQLEIRLRFGGPYESNLPLRFTQILNIELLCTDSFEESFALCEDWILSFLTHSLKGCWGLHGWIKCFLIKVNKLSLVFFVFGNKERKVTPLLQTQICSLDLSHYHLLFSVFEIDIWKLGELSNYWVASKHKNDYSSRNKNSI